MALISAVRYVPGSGVLVTVTASTSEAWTVTAPGGAALTGVGPSVVLDPRVPYGAGVEYRLGASVKRVDVPRLLDGSVVRLVPVVGGPGVETGLADTRAAQEFTPRLELSEVAGSPARYGWGGPPRLPRLQVRLEVPAVAWDRAARVLTHAGRLWWVRGGAVEVPSLPLVAQVAVTGRVTSRLRGHGPDAVVIVDADLDVLDTPVGQVGVCPWLWGDLGAVWPGNKRLDALPFPPQPVGGGL